MDIGIVGINHKQASLRFRERMAKVCHDRFGPHKRRSGMVLLSTCNRTELFFSEPDLAAMHQTILSELRDEFAEGELQSLYSFFGLDAFEHLARVSAGLDSAVIAETDITRQVKRAYYDTADICWLPAELHFLFQKCLRISKKVRTALDLRPGMPDTESAIFELAREHFPDVERCRCLFVGASEINGKVLCKLRARGLSDITLCNRTLERASLSVVNDGEVAIERWDHLSAWHSYDVVVFGTKSPEHLLTHRDIPKDLSSSKLVVDLAVPRNVDPAVQRHSSVELYNIEKIHRHVEKSRRLKSDVLVQGQLTIENEVERQMAIFGRKQLRTCAAS